MFKRLVYLVDDDKSFLNALARLTRRRFPDWTFQFFEDTDAALQKISSSQPAVVISDKLMPKQDGESFLLAVADVRPQSVRVLLSGDLTKDTLVSGAYVSHYMLSKPFDIETFANVLTRAEGLLQLPICEALRTSLGQVRAIPVMAHEYQTLITLLEQDEVNLVKIAGLIELDPGLLLKVLQIANSAMLGFTTPVRSAKDAAVRLGLDLLKSLLLFEGVFKAYETDPAAVEKVYARSITASHLASQIMTFAGGNKAQAEQALIAGLFHNVGYLTLSALNACRGAGCSYLDVTGENCALCSAYLLKLWGIDDEIVAAVQCSSAKDVRQNSLLQRVVWVACILAAGERASLEQNEALLTDSAFVSWLPESLAKLA